MLGYTARRVLSAVLVVFGVTLATFLLMHVEPGDPARPCSGYAPPLPPSPPFGGSGAWTVLCPCSWAGSWASSSKATSASRTFTMFRRPRSSCSRVGQTAALVAVATVFAVIITVPLAPLAASRKNGWPTIVVRAVSVVGLALPAFWFGICADRDLRRAPARLARRRSGQRFRRPPRGSCAPRRLPPPSPLRRSSCAA